MSRETLLNIAGRCVTSDEDLIQLIAERPRGRVQTVNLHHLALARRSDRFAEVTSAANYVTADGWPIVWALKGLRGPLARVTGSEFVKSLLTDKRLTGLRIGLLGATKDSGDRFAQKLEGTGVALVFREHGRRQDWDPGTISSSLEEKGVDLLLVAVTPPHGDEVGHEIHRAGFSGTVMAVGGAIDMTVLAKKPAPAFVKRLNAEWLFRLVQEPRRLFARYILICLPVFITDVIPTVVKGRSRK